MILLIVAPLRDQRMQRSFSSMISTTPRAKYLGEQLAVKERRIADEQFKAYR
jgi:hypothetical protein